MKAIVYIVHGLGEYTLRYDHVAKHFNTLGFRVHAVDFPGHGKTEGSNRGHVGGLLDVYRTIDALLHIDSDLACPKFIVLDT